MKVIAGLSLVLVLIASTAIAQDKYPSRPVTMVVGFAAGGAGDAMSRLVAETAREKRGAVVAVEFKPGAGATIGAGYVARSKPDGYTLGFYAGSPFLTAPHMQRAPYDVTKDFTFMAVYCAISLAAYVKSDSPFKSFKDVVAFARANPGKLRWSTATPRGSAEIMTTAAFRKEGVQTTLVPFGGGSEAIIALLGGHIDLSVSSDYGPQLNAGNLRVLAETGTIKIPNMPNIPTFAELGYPIAETQKYGVFGPAGLPKEVVTYWETLILEMTKTPAYDAALKKMWFTPLYEDSPVFTHSVLEAYKRFGDAIDTLGLKTK